MTARTRQDLREANARLVSECADLRAQRDAAPITAETVASLLAERADLRTEMAIQREEMSLQDEELADLRAQLAAMTKERDEAIKDHEDACDAIDRCWDAIGDTLSLETLPKAIRRTVRERNEARERWYESNHLRADWEEHAFERHTKVERVEKERDAAIARAEAAERVVEAAREYRDIAGRVR